MAASTLTAGTDGTYSGYSDGVILGAFGALSPTSLGGNNVHVIVTTAISPGEIGVYSPAGTFAAYNGAKLIVDGVTYNQTQCDDLGTYIAQTYAAPSFAGFSPSSTYSVDLVPPPVYAGPTHAAVTAGTPSSAAITGFSLTSIRGVGRRMFLAVMTANQTMPTPTGWNLFVPDSGTPSRGTAGAAGGVKMTVFWKDSDATETTVDFADSGDIQYVVGYSVAKAAGASGIDFAASVAGNAASSTSGSFTCPTTPVDDCFIITFEAHDRDAAGSFWSAAANASLTNVAERFDNATSTNTGGGVLIITGEKKFAGAVSNTTATQSTASAYAWITIALKNVASGGPNYVLTAATGAFNLSGQAAVTRYGRKMAASTGAFSLTGYAAVTRYGRRMFSENGAFTFGGQSAGLLRAARMLAASGAFTLSGQDARVGRGLRLTAELGMFNLSGSASSLLRGYRMGADLGAFDLAGQAASVTSARRMVAATGDFTLAAGDVNLLRGYRLPAQQGTFLLAGQAALTRYGRRMSASVGSFVLNGVDVAMPLGRRVVADTGAFIITGYSAELVWSEQPVFTHYVLETEPGAFVLAGSDAALRIDRRMVAAAGSFNFAGQSVAFPVARRLTASVGTFILAGQVAGTIAARRLTAETGQFAFSGEAVALLRGLRLTAEVGEFKLDGNDVAIRRGYVMPAGIGAFVLEGMIATLRKRSLIIDPSRVISASPESRVASASIELRFTEASTEVRIAASSAEERRSEASIENRHAEASPEERLAASTNENRSAIASSV